MSLVIEFSVAVRFVLFHCRIPQRQKMDPAKRKHTKQKSILVYKLKARRPRQVNIPQMKYRENDESTRLFSFLFVKLYDYVCVCLARPFLSAPLSISPLVLLNAGSFFVIHRQHDVIRNFEREPHLLRARLFSCLQFHALSFHPPSAPYTLLLLLLLNIIRFSKILKQN